MSSPLRYLPRFQLTGIARLICPSCGHEYRRQIRPGSYRVDCSGGCGNARAIGLVSYEFPLGPVTAPSDLTIPPPSLIDLLRFDYDPRVSENIVTRAGAGTLHPSGLVEAFAVAELGGVWRTGSPVNRVYSASYEKLEDEE